MQRPLTRRHLFGLAVAAPLAPLTRAVAHAGSAAPVPSVAAIPPAAAFAAQLVNQAAVILRAHGLTIAVIPAASPPPPRRLR